MKKIVSLLLALMLLLSTAAMAETVKFVEYSDEFDITVEIDDTIDFLPFETYDGSSAAHFQKKEGGAHVFVTVQASEQFEGNLADLSEDERAQLIELLSMDTNKATLEVTTETTPKGNMYFHFHAVDDTNVEQLWILYRGHVVTFVLFPEMDANNVSIPVTDADHEFMFQIFHDMDIVPVVAEAKAE